MTFSWSIRRWITAFPLLVLLVCTAAGSLLIHRVWRAQVEFLESQLRSTVATMAVSLDRQLAADLVSVQALTLGLAETGGELSPSHPAVADLYARSQALLRAAPMLRVVALNDASGQQIFNTRLPLGSALPAATGLAHERSAIASGQPLLSDVYTTRNIGAQVASFVVPLRLGGRACVLVASIDLRALGAGLGPEGLGDSAVVGLLDRQQRFVTRSVDAEHWIGQPPSPGWKSALAAQGARGALRLSTLEGVASVSAWAPLPRSGWTLGIAVPAEPWEAAVRHALLLYGGTAGLLGLAGAALAWWLGRSLVRSTSELKASAASLVRSERFLPAQTGVAEFDSIARDLQQAAQSLTRQREARSAVEAAQVQSLLREKESRLQAEEANRLKDEFMAVLGHELRNPLAAIVSATAVLQRMVGSDERPQKMLALIERQGENLNRLINDLLRTGRGTSLQQTVHPRRIDLQEVVGHSVSMLQQAGVLARHALRVETEPTYIDGDSARLEQLVTNLLSNAARYTPLGGSIELSLRADARTQEAVLTVRDSGIGVPGKMLKAIFEMFVQARPHNGGSAAAESLGVGLAVVQRIAMLHGGAVLAESPGVGQGTTFEVRLPLAHGATPGAAAPDRDAHAQTSRRFDGLVVAVVDDHQDLRESLLRLLTLAGCHAHGLPLQGDAAGPPTLARLQALTPALVLLGVAEEAHDGSADPPTRLAALPGLVQGLREDSGRKPRPRVVAVCSSGQPLPGCLQVLVDATLVKPLSETSLAEQLALAAEAAEIPAATATTTATAATVEPSALPARGALLRLPDRAAD